MSSVGLAFILCAIVGAGVLGSNWRRPLNRVFFFYSLLTCGWLAALAAPASPRLIGMLGALYPPLLWWMKECCADPAAYVWQRRWRSGWPWLACSAALLIFCGSPAFGSLHPVYTAGLGLSYASLIVVTWLEQRHLEGLSRVEVQTVLLGAIGSCSAGLLIAPLFPRYAHLIVIGFYAATAWAISTRKVFDASHLFLSGMRWTTVVFVLAAWLYVWQRLAAPFLPPLAIHLTGIATAVAMFVVLEHPLRRLFSFGLMARRQQITNYTRRELLTACREVGELQPLKDRLESILIEWSASAFAEILVPAGEGRLAGRTVSVADLAVIRALAQENWATPESLVRQRRTPDQEALLAFMAAHHVYAITARRAWTGGDLLLVVCLGAKRRRVPFTYPECQDLLEWTDLAETAIARSALTVQAKEAEHIKTIGLMGASIAHEMRNPLVALSAAAELLEEKHANPEFRRTFSALIDREVGRIKAISEQLRGLSPAPAPQPQPVRLSGVISECVELVQARAAKHGAEVIFPSRAAELDALADPGLLRQVLLNLLGNAIDAVETRGPGGRIHIGVTRSGKHVLIDVSDNGKGVSAEQRKKLFTPFASDKTNGFGLGLATSQKLMRSLHGSIALVDREGPGATFRLSLPCPPASIPIPATS